MKVFSLVLIGLFALVGAHVPKAYSLLVVALVFTALKASREDHRALPPMAADRLLSWRTAQVLVLVFSCSYPLAMLHFEFWQLSGRQLLDVVSAVVLPSGLLWWGHYWARRDLRLFLGCWLSYGLGGLLFLLAALIKTRGWAWFAPQVDSGSLLMAWGSEASMNVRSIEQNGILCVVLAPVALRLLWRRRYLAAGATLLVALIGWLAVLPLHEGRLWIVSLALACWPLAAWSSRSLWGMLHFWGVSDWARFGVPLTASAAVAVGWAFRPHLCDERFSIYAEALRHWPELIAGGRILQYPYQLCNGQTAALALQESGGPASGLSFLHNVPLDVLASVGLGPSLPLLLLLILALWAAGSFLLMWCRPGGCSLQLQLFWGVLAVLVPQWLFQPLLYGDGLLYYLSYSALGALLAITAFNVGDGAPGC